MGSEEQARPCLSCSSPSSPLPWLCQHLALSSLPWTVEREWSTVLVLQIPWDVQCLISALPLEWIAPWAVATLPPSAHLCHPWTVGRGSPTVLVLLIPWGLQDQDTCEVEGECGEGR